LLVRELRERQKTVKYFKHSLLEGASVSGVLYSVN